MKKRVLSFLLAMLLLLSISMTAYAAPTDEKTLRHTVARVYTGFVISVDEVFVESQWQPDGAGTGFFIGREGEDPQYLITNQHVIESYQQNGAGAPFVARTDDGSEVYVRAQIRVYYDQKDYSEAYIVEAGDPLQSKDFAILRLAEPTDKRASLPLTIPSQAVSDPNRSIFTVGFPGVADNEDFKSTSISGEGDSHITKGMVNKIFTQTSTGTQILEFDATINQGNSGGPLILDNGAAIGVTTWALTGGNVPMYYAVGMETIKPYLDRYNVPYTLIGENPTPDPEPSTVPSPFSPT